MSQVLLSEKEVTSMEREKSRLNLWCWIELEMPVSPYDIPCIGRYKYRCNCEHECICVRVHVILVFISIFLPCPLRRPRVSNISTEVNMPSTQILVCKCCFPVEKSMTSWTNSWFQVWGREITNWAWNIPILPKKKEVPKK